MARGTADEIWIPAIAKRHGIVITQDLNVHRTRAQWELCQTHEIGVFFFKPPKTRTWNYWEILRTMVRLWAELKELAAKTQRPYGFSVDVRRGKFLRI